MANREFTNINGINVCDQTARDILSKCIYYIKNSDWNIHSDGTNSIDTTNGINNAISYAYENGYRKIVFEKGNYLIHVEDAYFNNPNGYIDLQSNLEYDLNFSTFQIETNDEISYTIFNIHNKDNIIIKNGTLIGDRKNHDYSGLRNDGEESTHEFGVGILIAGGHNIQIYNNTMYDFTGDCMCVMASQKYDSSTNTNIRNRNSEDIVIENNDLSHSRRQGISICSAERIYVKNNIIHDIGNIEDGISGTDPRFGIDLEGYTDIENVHMCYIDSNKFYNNNRSDIYLASRNNKISITNNYIEKTENSDGYNLAIGGSGQGGTIYCDAVVLGNTILNGNIGCMPKYLIVSNNKIENGNLLLENYNSYDNEGNEVVANNNIVINGRITVANTKSATINGNFIANYNETSIEKAITVLHTMNSLNHYTRANINSNTVLGNFTYGAIADATASKTIVISNCNFETKYIGGGYFKDCNFNLTATEDQDYLYESFYLENCNIYYNGNTILKAWTANECKIQDCIFYNLDSTKISVPIEVTHGSDYPDLAVINSYYHNCNNKQIFGGSINKLTLINNYFEKTSEDIISVLNTVPSLTFCKNNIFVNYNE